MFIGDPIGDIVNAYKNGKKINQSYHYKTYGKRDYLNRLFPTMISPQNKDDLYPIHVDADFTGLKGNFIAFINGHQHGDFCGYSSHYSDQLILNVNSGCGDRFVDGDYERLFSDLPRSMDENDETRDCYNVYVFDIQSHQVHVVRIGSHLTTDLSLRRTWSYKW